MPAEIMHIRRSLEQFCEVPSQDVLLTEGKQLDLQPLWQL